ncbi:CsgG/HfaB family protein [Glaciecola sp. SC05]|uniref:CsgG/HfaB family protein n=1 Tax=Glaciecola sp. SC05 TaxID=1987355 RepID=UPI003527EDAD
MQIKHSLMKLQSKQTMLGIALATSLLITGCMSTTPSLGGSSGNTVTGGAAGANTENANNSLEQCDTPLGTLALFEDRSLPWWGDYRNRYPNLGSTEPVIRTMIQQSNCFVVVERGAAMNAMNRERELMQSGQLRSGSNIGGGQMVTADYTVSPSIQFSAKGTGGLKGVAGGLFGSIGSVIGGGLSKNEAATTLLLIDNRSGVQVSSAVGSAGNYDFDIFGGFFAGIAGGAKGFSNSPEGKIITAAFADSYNQMVMALRNYKPQQVQGGLGMGGQLTVDGQRQATEGASIVAAPQNRPTVVVETRNTSSITTNSDFKGRINAYDERAMQKYYDHLKNAAETLSGFAEIGSMDATGPGGMDYKTAMRSAVNIFSNQIESASIELEAWPSNAKAEGWRVLGSRIERYTEMFYKSRDAAVEAGKLTPEISSMLEGITLLSKADFVN